MFTTWMKEIYTFSLHICSIKGIFYAYFTVGVCESFWRLDADFPATLFRCLIRESFIILIKFSSKLMNSSKTYFIM